jgi:hypothetical protein
MSERNSLNSVGTGYDEFLGILKRFNKLSVIALSSGAAVPFAAYAASIAPPWPPGIMLLTGLTEFLSLIVSFQFFRTRARKVISRAIGVSVSGTLGVSFIYLLLFAMFTFTTPKTGERWVKGFVCNADIAQLYGSECPFLGLRRIQEAQYNSENLWLDWSVALMRVVLSSTWLLSFLLCSASIGIFLVFQTKRPAGNIGARSARRAIR